MDPENIHTPTMEGIGNLEGLGRSEAQDIPEGRGGLDRVNFKLGVKIATY